MAIDRDSPPGSWEREWDATAHSISEYQREIRELRERIRSYLKDIEERDKTIAKLTEELALIDKFWLKQNRHE